MGAYVKWSVSLNYRANNIGTLFLDLRWKFLWAEIYYSYKKNP
jgi:hypothetical protein